LDKEKIYDLGGEATHSELDEKKVSNQIKNSKGKVDINYSQFSMFLYKIDIYGKPLRLFYKN
jgi:hypothetical protein